MRFLVFFLLAIIAGVIAEEETCTPGKPYKKWCNTCMCSWDGKPEGCTRMECNHNIWNKDGTYKYFAYALDRNNGVDRVGNDLDDLTSCVPGESFKIWCNTCKCSLEGKPAECTRKLCDRDIYNKDGTTNFYLYYEGNTNGGDRKRREVEGTKSCVPGKIFMRYCNSCRCSVDGKPEACTEFKCDLNRWNEDGTVKLVRDELDYDDSLYYLRK